jgi:hypothetical protein
MPSTDRTTAYLRFVFMGKTLWFDHTNSPSIPHERSNGMALVPAP